MLKIDKSRCWNGEYHRFTCCHWDPASIVTLSHIPHRSSEVYKYALKSWRSCTGCVLRVCPVLQLKPNFNLSISFQPAHLRLSQESTSLGMISLCLVPTNEASPRRFLSCFNHQITLLSCSHCSLDQNQDSSLRNFKGINQLPLFSSCPTSHLIPIV